MDVFRKSKLIPFCIIIAVGAIYLTSFLSLPKVTIAVDGRMIELRTSKKYAKDILSKARIATGPLDIIKEHLQDRGDTEKSIRITRVEQKKLSQTEPIPFTVISRSLMTRNLRPVELIKGYEGTRDKEFLVTYHDQKEYERELLTQKQKKNIIFKIAVKNKDGSTEKGYDLSKAKKMYVTATAYYPGDPMCKPYDGFTTAIGMKLERGLVAVDPKVIPLRSRLYIPKYGYAYAADTGGMIKGKRIDVCVADSDAAYRFGRQSLLVYILE
ncbi:MAG: 3D domain-containing protein [bacterium]